MEDAERRNVVALSLLRDAGPGPDCEGEWSFVMPHWSLWAKHFKRRLIIFRLKQTGVG